MNMIRELENSRGVWFSLKSATNWNFGRRMHNHKKSELLKKKSAWKWTGLMMAFYRNQKATWWIKVVTCKYIPYTVFLNKALAGANIVQRSLCSKSFSHQTSTFLLEDFSQESSWKIFLLDFQKADAGCQASSLRIFLLRDFMFWTNTPKISRQHSILMFHHVGAEHK